MARQGITESDRLAALLQAVVACVEDALVECEPSLLAAARGAVVAHIIAALTVDCEAVTLSPSV